MCVSTNYHTTTASSSETCPLWPLCLAEQARRGTFSETSCEFGGGFHEAVASRLFGHWEHLPGSSKINENAIGEFLQLHPKLGFFLHFLNSTSLLLPSRFCSSAVRRKMLNVLRDASGFCPQRKNPQGSAVCWQWKEMKGPWKACTLRIFDAAHFVGFFWALVTLKQIVNSSSQVPCKRKNVLWNIEYVLSFIDIYKLHDIVYR